MTELVVIALVVACILLWRRMERAEQALQELGERIELLREVPVAVAEQPDPVAPAAIPARRIEPVGETVVAEPEPEPETETVSPPPPPEPEPVEEPPAKREWSIDFEELFGRRLPIWAGGVALAVAGVFLVRYSIEAGLLTPVVRVALAFVFGVALLAGAEAAYRYEHRIADPRVRQALAGAGLATIYAAFYLAGTQYGLIGQVAAFLGLAAVTAAAIALSYRFGLPSAVLGLIGGFAAPALVGGEEASLPLLSIYLGLVTAGLALTGKRQARPWLGMAALAAGLGWGALMLLAGDFDVAGLLALGLYLTVIGTLVPALAVDGRTEVPVRIASAAVAAVQVALLVQQAGYTPLGWGLYLLLGAALAWFGHRMERLRDACGLAALLGTLLLAGWSEPPGTLFAIVLAGIALLFAAWPLVYLRRGTVRAVDMLQAALVPPALAAIAYARFGDLYEEATEPALAATCLALAAIPLAGAWLLRARDERLWPTGLAGSGAALVYAALLLLTPGWSAPLAAMPVLAALVWLARHRGDAESLALLWIGAVVGVLALFATGDAWREALRLGMPYDGFAIRSLLRWLAVAAPFAALAWLEQRRPTRHAAGALAAILLYGALAQIVPSAILAWTAAGLSLAIAFAKLDRIGAQVALAGIAGLWAVPPLAEWGAAALASLYGAPVMLTDLPDLTAVSTRLLPSLAILLSLPRTGVPLAQRSVSPRWLAAPLALVVAHIGYKHLFAVETVTQFVAAGLAERTVWGALLLLAAWLADKRNERPLAIALAATALVYIAYYSGLLHNPLWAEQAVGPVPLANLALAWPAVGIAAALALRHWLGERSRPLLDGIVMLFASIAALGVLRQVFAGSLLTGEPLGQTEDLLRSLLGIVLALGFLALGSRLRQRSWRVGSLVLMVVAVAKVFLVDAAGLDGLLRVASFMALGFSLIGIGWVYSRQLRGPVQGGGGGETAP